MVQRALRRLRFGRDHRWLAPRASGYLDGDLRPREVARVQRHLEQCPRCRELVRSLQEIISALGTMAGADGEDELVAGAILESVKSRLGDLPPTGG